MSRSSSLPANSAAPVRARLLLPPKASPQKAPPPKAPPRKSVLFAAALFLLAACRASAPAAVASHAGFRISAPGFANGAIPRVFTCDGANDSPPLAWSTPRHGTRALALTLTDPDAPSGTFTHWVLFNLPAATRTLPQGLAATPRLPDGSLQGTNSFRRIGYGGPCPPLGSTHRYIFTLYALDAPLTLAPGSLRADVESALAGHILEKTELIARYSR